MQENNKTYTMHRGLRVHTDVLKDKYLNININQDIEELEILSLKLDVENFYKLHTSSYGCLVGRVLANQGLGIPNVKISVFIPAENADLQNPVFRYLYPYTNVKSRNQDGVRYNLLPEVVDDRCHQDIGTFPNKRLVLDDVNVIEVFDKYFKYTTVTNDAGDYMIFGLPVGQNIIHSELDLSDIGMLSQKPRDLYYKGYGKTLFENSSQFKKDTNLDYLTQVISQDNSVQVYPFWGDDETEDYPDVDKQVKITRHDVDINYKFEPTCIFIGSLVADDKSNGFSKKCIPTERSGKMDRLTTGAGTIEMIRKRPDGTIESFSIQGNDLIDGNGTWCYQIPMNLDYIKTDEYGNIVHAENEQTGIPTRTSVRFRISLADYESDSANAHLPKVLVPNNPTLTELTTKIKVKDNTGAIISQEEGPDYNFGTYTRGSSFRDLMWNNVYTIKQYIPRLQNIIFEGRHIDRNKNFSGIKAVNVNGSNNPIPYNNIRVNLTFLFIFQCIIFKALVLIVRMLNKMIYAFTVAIRAITCTGCGCTKTEISYILLDGSMCPAMEGYYMALGAKAVTATKTELGNTVAKELIMYTSLKKIEYDARGNGSGIEQNNSDLNAELSSSDNKTDEIDPKSSDSKYSSSNITYFDNSAHTTGNEDTGVTLENGENAYPQMLVSASGEYFVKCVELQFAMEYEVIQFDFYNDWINGLVFLPRWFAELKRKKRVDHVVACNENNRNIRELVQQCALEYDTDGVMKKTNRNCGGKWYGCHKQSGRRYVPALKNPDNDGSGGIIRTYKNKIDDRYLYYLRPAVVYNNKKANLFATDIVLLGGLNDCNRYGLPTAVGYPSSSFVMPPPTGELLSDSQEMSIWSEEDENYKCTIDDKNYWFIKQNKRSQHQEDGEELAIEMSGIDWGYNPFKIGDDDDTSKIENQQGGHFLEIGCVASSTTPKSCLNLQRICELGSEMSQSHFYRNGNGYVKASGVISTREVNGQDIRTQFALLNSNRLTIGNDRNDGFKRYIFLGYTPYSFNNSFNNWVGYDPLGSSELDTFIKELNETNSISYQSFRFNSTSTEAYNSYKVAADGTTFDVKDKFLIKNEYPVNNTTQVSYQMPVYENSFYFYFGLKDGNTAIDRLYGEYFSECNSGEIDNSINGE